MAEGKSKSNYAINPTPEPDLRSNRAVLPARVIAALEPHGNHSMNASLSLREQLMGNAPLWFVFWVVCVLGSLLVNLGVLFVMARYSGSRVLAGANTEDIAILALVGYAAASLYLVWRCRRNSNSGVLLWVAEFLPKYFLVGGMLMIIAQAVAWVYGVWF